MTDAAFLSLSISVNFMSAFVRLAAATSAVAPVVRSAVLRHALTSPTLYHLGLDVSSSHVGCALLSADGRLLRSAVCKNTSRAGLFDFAVTACNTIDQLCGDNELASVTVEEALKAFAGGRTSIQAIFKLGQLNAVIVHEMRRRTAAKTAVGPCPVRCITPNAVRALWGIAIRGQSDGAADTVATATADTSIGASIDDPEAAQAIPLIAFPAAPASANATKIAAMRAVTDAFPGLLEIWARPRGGRKSSTPVAAARASDYDRSDAVLLAMTGAVQVAEDACVQDAASFAAAAEAAAPFLLRPHEMRGTAVSGSAVSPLWPPDRVATRLSAVHESLRQQELPKGHPRSPARAVRARKAAEAAAAADTTNVLPREDTAYTMLRGAVRAGVVKALLEDVWTGATEVVDAGG